MESASPMVTALIQLAVILFGFYLILYHLTGKRLKYTPGQVIGLTLRGIIRSTWWLIVNVFQVTAHALLALLNTSSAGSSRRSSTSRDKERVVEGAHFLEPWPKFLLMRQFFKDGLVIDGKRRISRKHSYRHAVVLGATGSGKSTIVTLPNLLRAQRNASYVVIDPSGEAFHLTSGYLAKKGFKIKVFNVSDPSRSLQYNPLARATTTTLIEQLCSILVNAAFSDSRPDQDFWNRGAMTLISIIIRCLAKKPEEYKHLAGVYNLLNRFGADGRPLYRFISENADEQTFTEFKGFIGNSEKVIQGMAATARTSLKALNDPLLASLTAKETLHFESVREEPTILYIQVPEDRVRYYGFLLSIFWSQFFSACMSQSVAGKKHLPVFALMDEFGNLGRIPHFESLITTLRKRNVSVTLLLQDAEQLTTLYGRAGASTIINGAVSSRIFLPGLSHETCRDVEGILGKQTIRSHGRTETRPLLAADEVRTLDDSQGIFVFANQRPVLLQMQPYYKSILLSLRSKIPPVPYTTAKEVGSVAYLEENAKPAMSRRPVLHTQHEAPSKYTVLSETKREEQRNREHAEPKARNEVPRRFQATPSAAPPQTQDIDPIPMAEPALEPPWAQELLQESKRARHEIEGLRDAIGIHVVSRREAARMLQKSTKTLQRWEKQGIIERVDVSAPGVHYDFDRVVELKKRIS